MRSWHITRQRLEQESLRRAKQTERETLEWNFWKQAPESDFWDYLGGKFEALAAEELETLRTRPKEDCRIRAFCTYNSDMTPAESDLVNQRLVCLLFRPASGSWVLSDGPNEYLKARMEVLASRGGVRLGPPEGIKPAEYWLHSLCNSLRKTQSANLFARSDTGGLIQNVCESSATFCSRLEKNALEASELGRERDVERKERRLASRDGLQRREHKRERGDPEVAKRTKLIKSNPDVQADDMCGILDRERVPLPARWTEGGLRSWKEAHRNASYRDRVDVIFSKDRRRT